MYVERSENDKDYGSTHIVIWKWELGVEKEKCYIQQELLLEDMLLNIIRVLNK